MKVLVVGSGGREHALVWKIAQSPRVTKLYCAPGNAGIASMAECIPINAMDIPAISDFAEDLDIDLVVVGPEAPLTQGLSDELRARGIRTFGPSQAAAMIEGSKVFSKELMAKYDIPTAAFEVFDNPDDAKAFIERIAIGCNCPIVIKADGEALGKGVFVCTQKDEALQAVDTIMIDKAFGKAGDKLVIEELLVGQEASLMAITDGEHVVPMTPVQDHKRAFDGDLGPNTGGMGCYSPVPFVSPELYNEVIETIIKPTIRAMKAEGRTYTGVLYTGIILTEDGPKVLEYNARFGDPETQVALPLLETDLIDIIEACLSDSLDSLEIKCYNGAAVCVVIASGGYPGEYETGKTIFGLEEAGELDRVMVFHAGTKFREDDIVTSGGRVLGVTGIGKTFEEAIEKAYSGVDKIHFADMHYRKDIGKKALGQC